MRRAIELATENVTSGTGGPFGAVIVRDGKIVGEGVNTVTATHDPTAHAEVNAIRAAAKSLDTFTLAGCELYTSCEPCPMCLAAATGRVLTPFTTAHALPMRPARDLTTPFSTKSCAKITLRAVLPSTQIARRRGLGQLCGVDRFAKIEY